MSARRRRHWRMEPLPGGLQAVASEVHDGHQALVQLGYGLCEGASGAWRLRDGLLRVRLVYRRGAASVVFSARVRVTP